MKVVFTLAFVCHVAVTTSLPATVPTSATEKLLSGQSSHASSYSRVTKLAAPGTEATSGSGAAAATMLSAGMQATAWSPATARAEATATAASGTTGRRRQQPETIGPQASMPTTPRTMAEGKLLIMKWHWYEVG